MTPGGPEDWVVVGRVVRPHGLGGEVSVEVLTDFPSRFDAGHDLFRVAPGGDLGKLTVESSRPHGERLLVRFAGVAGGSEAEGRRGAELLVAAGDEPERPPGYFFHWELRGFAVVDTAGLPLGTAGDIVEAGGLPLLVVETPAGERDVPFRAPIFVSADAEERRVVLDPPEGLLD
ncbi:16S rRNA processing protein RimM [Acidobacteria bacterium ACD]|nr:16S rRNA processing protein RimM [Acidobacteria bacterium ACD]